MESNAPDAAEQFSFDVVVIGAGPTGLACGIDAKRAGFTVTNIDKGCLVNSLYNYPSNMTFFTTPELLEIGDIPFSSPNQKPTRQEALEYYRKVTEHYQLDVRQYEAGADASRAATAILLSTPRTCMAAGASTMRAS